MKKSNTALNNELREKFLAQVMEQFATAGEEVMQTGSNTMAFPVLDSEGGEKWIEIVVKVPTSWVDGEDGYALAEEYRLNTEAKARKKAETAKKKAEKAQRDAEERARKKAQREALKAQVEGAADEEG